MKNSFNSKSFLPIPSATGILLILYEYVDPDISPEIVKLESSIYEKTFTSSKSKTAPCSNLNFIVLLP